EWGGRRVAQLIRGWCAGLPRLSVGEKSFDRCHGCDDLCLLRGFELVEHGAGVALRTFLHRSEQLASACREREVALPPVLLRRFAADQAALFEIAKKAAEISRIKVEGARDVACSELVGMCELVEHAHFAQGVGTVQVRLAQDADLPRVEAVELADGRNAGPGCHGPDSVGKLVDKVKYIDGRARVSPAGGLFGAGPGLADDQPSGPCRPAARPPPRQRC